MDFHINGKKTKWTKGWDVEHSIPKGAFLNYGTWFHEKETLEKFKNYIFTIEVKTKAIKDSFPSFLKKSKVSEIQLEKLKGYLWIELFFPEPFGTSFFSEYEYHLNCIPLMARQLKTFVSEIELGTFPFESNSKFLGLESFEINGEKKLSFYVNEKKKERGERILINLQENINGRAKGKYWTKNSQIRKVEPELRILDHSEDHLDATKESKIVYVPSLFDVDQLNNNDNVIDQYLSNHNNLISRGDIKRFIFLFFKNDKLEIVFQRGTYFSPKSENGVEACMNVTVSFPEKNDYSRYDFTLLEQELNQRTLGMVYINVIPDKISKEN